MSDMATSLRTRLNSDLVVAMKAKDTVCVAALRSLLSAMDNASAVPMNTVAPPDFGRNGDVPRKNLSDAECAEIVRAEARARIVTAEEYARLGQRQAAARLRAEQAVIERYLGADRSVRAEASTVTKPLAD